MLLTGAAGRHLWKWGYLWEPKSDMDISPYFIFVTCSIATAKAKINVTDTRCGVKVDGEFSSVHMTPRSSFLWYFVFFTLQVGH